MVSYNLLAPLIAGAVIALVGVLVLIWMNSTEPRRQLSMRPEEEAHDPFDHRIQQSLMQNIHDAVTAIVRQASKKGPAVDLHIEADAPVAKHIEMERETAA